MKSLLLATAASLVATATAGADTFRNDYVTFELPAGWKCALKQAEFICRSGKPGADTREAVIILTAKETGPMDSLQGYEAHLRRPVQMHTKSGRLLQSTVYSVEQQRINNHVWINGFHFNSEVPGYYTRYLATLKDDIALVVTFTAHKLHYTKYSRDFGRAIQTLKILSSGPGGGGKAEAAIPEAAGAARSPPS